MMLIFSGSFAHSTRILANTSPQIQQHMTRMIYVPINIPPPNPSPSCSPRYKGITQMIYVSLKHPLPHIKQMIYVPSNPSLPSILFPPIQQHIGVNSSPHEYGGRAECPWA